MLVVLCRGVLPCSAKTISADDGKAEQKNKPEVSQEEHSGPVGDEEGAFNEHVDSMPVPISRTSPQYPDDLDEEGISGGVILSFVVDTKGKVRNIKIIRFTDERFVNEAIRAVKGWKYKPAISGGKPICSRVQQSVVFEHDIRDRKGVVSILNTNDRVLYRNLDNKPVVTEFHDPSKILLTHSTFLMKLLVAVEVDGSVRNVSSDKQPSSEVETSVHQTVLQWRFEPGLFKGEPVRYLVPVFVLINPKKQDGTPLKQQGFLERPLVLCISPALPQPTMDGAAATSVKAKQETSAATPASPAP
jgi:TonB family protein